MRSVPAALLLALAALAAPAADPDVDAIAAAFDAEVDRRVDLAGAAAPYARRVEAALADAGIGALTPQYLLVVDRAPRAQAAMLWWWGPERRLIGATAASTGRPGAYEYFETPVGVFRHAAGNPDFRAEGTRNDHGVLGYGPEGLRVYDFGWQPARRTWGAGGASLMRLQVHSTDPELLESRLGTRQSKGCIRIPASLNRFLDRHGLLDADYAAAAALGMGLAVRQPERPGVPGAGRYLVVVDSRAGAAR